MQPCNDIKMTEAARLMLVIQILETLPEQTVSTAYPPIDESLSSLNDVRGSSKSEGWQGTCICNISPKMLKGGGEAMIHGLHAVMSAA